MTIPDEAVQAAQDEYQRQGEKHNWSRSWPDAECMTAILTAALPFLQGVKVKALEWSDHQHGSRCATDRVYDISIWMEGGKPLYVDSYTTMRRFRIMNEAKAAAQADYAARILSAIEPAPSPRAQALEEMLTAAYVRGADWAYENGPDFAEYRFKAANDYTEVKMHESALSSQPLSDGWLPIETCPPEHVLFFGVDRHGDKVAAEGFKAVNGTLCVGNKDLKPFTFTHWRPLPASPGASE
ncbi:hypothetical protein OIV19_20390 [Brucella sp. HL-2]|nr:hypothetical protein [Brucella sp. HL-2]MCV9909961.1 hypothetical protein [Brucella sp. HL-2]